MVICISQYAEECYGGVVVVVDIGVMEGLGDVRLPAWWGPSEVEVEVEALTDAASV